MKLFFLPKTMPNRKNSSHLNGYLVFPIYKVVLTTPFFVRLLRYANSDLGACASASAELGTRQCFSLVTVTTRNHVRASITSESPKKMLRPRCLNGVTATNRGKMQQAKQFVVENMVRVVATDVSCAHPIGAHLRKLYSTFKES